MIWADPTCYILLYWFFLLAEPFKTSFYCPTSHRKGKEAVYFLYITLWSYFIQPFLIEWQLWDMIIFLSTTAYPPQAQPGLTNFTRSVDRSLVCAHLNNYSNAFNIKVPNGLKRDWICSNLTKRYQKWRNLLTFWLNLNFFDGFWLFRSFNWH